jgi:PIN domain nuclease of toxin-antitoxin system
MTIEVFDACALIALLRDELGAALIESFLNDPDRICYVHAVTLCEVYYEWIRHAGEPAARLAIIDLYTTGIVERDDMDPSFWQSVGQIKARGRISIADCFCLALAIRVSGQVVTSDHKEFDPIVPLGLCPILFFR